MTIDNDELKKIILKSGFVDPQEFDQAEKAAADQNKQLGEVLVERGVILEKFLGDIIAKEIGYPYADLRDHMIGKEIIELIPEDLAGKKRSVAFEKQGSKVKVAFEDPNDVNTVDFIKKKIFEAEEKIEEFSDDNLTLEHFITKMGAFREMQRFVEKMPDPK